MASIFNAFGSQIQLFQTGPRILPSEDVDVSEAIAGAFRSANIAVHENIGAIEGFESAVWSADDLLPRPRPRQC